MRAQHTAAQIEIFQVWALNKYRHMLNNGKKITCQTGMWGLRERSAPWQRSGRTPLPRPPTPPDHKAIVFLTKKNEKPPALERLMQFIADLQYTVEYHQV